MKGLRRVMGVSIACNVLLAGILLWPYIARKFLWPFYPDDPKPWVVHESVSPDGKWRCTVTDIHARRIQYTYLYSIESTSGIKGPMDGTMYVSYEDSEGTGRPKFEWSANRLILTDYRKKLVADFDGRYQHWREVPREAETRPASPGLPP